MNLSFVGFSGKGIFPFRSEVIFLVRSEEDVETVRNSRVNEHFHASVPSHPPDWPAASNTMYSPAAWWIGWVDVKPCAPTEIQFHGQGLFFFLTRYEIGPELRQTETLRPLSDYLITEIRLLHQGNRTVRSNQSIGPTLAVGLVWLHPHGRQEWWAGVKSFKAGPNFSVEFQRSNGMLIRRADRPSGTKFKRSNGVGRNTHVNITLKGLTISYRCHNQPRDSGKQTPQSTLICVSSFVRLQWCLLPLHLFWPIIPRSSIAVNQHIALTLPMATTAMLVNALRVVEMKATCTSVTKMISGLALHGFTYPVLAFGNRATAGVVMGTSITTRVLLSIIERGHRSCWNMKRKKACRRQIIPF